MKKDFIVNGKDGTVFERQGFIKTTPAEIWFPLPNGFLLE